jgi:hypothetical protein
MKSYFSKCILILTLGSFIACNDKAADEGQAVNSDTLQIAEEDVMADDSIHVELQLEKVNAASFNLLIHMNLFGDSWIVSPLEKAYPFGEMTIEFDQNDHFVLIDSIIENPNAVYRNDPNWEAQYRVISGKTTLSQKIQLISKEDFDITGQIFFILEPICKPNGLYFKITQKDKKLTVQLTD